MNLSENVTSMFFPPSGKYLYFGTDLGIGVGPAILAFSIGTAGELIPSSAAYPFIPQPSVSGESGMTMDSQGRFIYISNYVFGPQYSKTGQQTNQITPFQLNPVPGGIVQGPAFSDNSAMDLTVEIADPEGNFLYAWNIAQNMNLGISVYKIDGSTGALAEISGSPFPVATASSNWPFGVLQFLGSNLVFSPSGKFAYANVLNYTGMASGGVNAEWDLYAFSVNSTTGALSVLPGYPLIPLPTNTRPNPIGMVMHPNGKFLYVSAYTGNQNPPPAAILIFAVDPSTGAVNPTPVSSVSDKYCCTTLLMDPTGALLLDEGSGWHSFTVNASTGLLTSAGTTDVDLQAPYDQGPGIIVRIP
jgi:6-phosphogluconolactonase (cycloisomerase 2 family)